MTTLQIQRTVFLKAFEKIYTSYVAEAIKWSDSVIRKRGGGGDGEIGY